MRVLGIEGTAWAASAAVYDTETDEVVMESAAYQPTTGGIHPREAAEHMATAIPSVIEAVFESTDHSIDAVAFSRGPGLGPCLRITATAARTVAQRHSVPLVGVNHMVAHLEVGRRLAGFDDPIGLNASGANAHVLAFNTGRYRVLGETMDTGIGNAIDKFTRHLGWQHPGGPKVEAAATDGDYIDLPYVVKGMDFSFSGIMSAAKVAVDAGERIEDVCCGFQETAFAMLTEVAERALSAIDGDELVLGGGVGQNRRLQTMLSTMCSDRGASFFVPPDEYLRDNGAMIAMLGADMAAVGETLDIAESTVNADYRPDQVPVSWRSQSPDRTISSEHSRVKGAESTVTIESDRVYKRRVPKRYRHPDLDDRLRRERTVAEARLTSEARATGVPTPLVIDVDLAEATITFERVGDADLRSELAPDRLEPVGANLARLHGGGIVHGDPTPRNIRIDSDRTYVIDFGLGFHSDSQEDFAMDVHVLEQALDGLAEDPVACRTAAREGYRSHGDPSVLEQVDEIQTRGRYR